MKQQTYTPMYILYIVYIVYGLEFKTDPIFSIQRALIYESVMTCSSALYRPAKVEGANSMDKTKQEQPIINYQEALDDYEAYIEETQAIELPETPWSFSN